MSCIWVPLLVLLLANAGALKLEKKFTCDPNYRTKFSKELSSIEALILKDVALGSPFLYQHNSPKLNRISCKSMPKILENLTHGKTNTILELLLQRYQTEIFALSTFHREYFWNKMSRRGYENTNIFLDTTKRLNTVARSKEVIKGKMLIFAARDQKPSISFKVDNDTGKVTDINGDNFEIIEMIASSLGFNYTFIPSFEGSAFNNGSWKGAIGMVVRKEADLNLQPFTYEADKNNVVDYSTFLTSVAFTLVIPYPKETRSLLASTWPFTPIVWLCVLVTMALITFTLTMAAYMRSKNKSILQAFLQSLIYTYGLITCQGLECPGRTHKSRLVAGIWGMGCLIFVYLYNSQLTSFLTVPQMKPLVNSIDDLARSNELQILIMPGNYLVMELLNANSGTYKVLGDRIRNNIKQHLAQSHEDGINMAASGRYAFAVNDYTATHYGNILFQKTRTCSIMIVKQPLNHVFSAFTMQKGSPYLPAINDKLMRIEHGGIVRYVMKYSGNGLPRFREHCKVPIKDFLTNVKLTLSQLLSAFTIWGVGLLAALAAFLSEVILAEVSSRKN